MSGVPPAQGRCRALVARPNVSRSPPAAIVRNSSPPAANVMGLARILPPISADHSSSPLSMSSANNVD